MKTNRKKLLSLLLVLLMTFSLLPGSFMRSPKVVQADGNIDSDGSGTTGPEEPENPEDPDEETGTVIPVNENDKTKTGYVRISFSGGENGTLTGKAPGSTEEQPGKSKLFYDVKENATYAEIKDFLPKVDANEGYSFEGWEPELGEDNETVKEKNYVAQYKEKENGDPDDKTSEESEDKENVYFEMGRPALGKDNNHIIFYEYTLEPEDVTIFNDMKISVTDSHGETRKPEKTATVNGRNNRRFCGKYSPDEELTITVDTSSIPDGWHVNYILSPACSFVLPEAVTADCWQWKIKLRDFEAAFEKEGFVLSVSCGQMDVRFDPLGGTIGDSEEAVNVRVKKNGKVEFPGDPVKDNLHFKGWFTRSDEGNKEDVKMWRASDTFTSLLCDVQMGYNDTSVDEQLDGIFLLRALWKADVTFDSQGGTAVETRDVIEGEQVQKPDDPSKDGYTFDGWYIDEEYKTAFDFDKPITKDIILYAKWKEQKVVKPSEATEPSEPRRIGLPIWQKPSGNQAPPAGGVNVNLLPTAPPGGYAPTAASNTPDGMGIDGTFKQPGTSQIQNLPATGESAMPYVYGVLSLTLAAVVIVLRKHMR